MEKYIVQYGYWLGVIFALLSLIWRGLVIIKLTPEKLLGLAYTTFYRGAVLFLVIVVGTTCYAWFKSQKT